MSNCKLNVPIVGDTWYPRHEVPKNLADVNATLISIEECFKRDFLYERELTITNTLLYIGWYSRRMFISDFKNYPYVYEYIQHAVKNQNNGIIPYINYIRKYKIKKLLEAIDE